MMAPAAKGFDSKGGEMAQHRLGVIMNGVTGRMGTNQHLVRSILAIRQQGGVALKNGDRVLPDPILLGRNADKLEALARQHGIARWSTDLEAALKNSEDTLFFDAATTQMRAGLLRRAMAAGKHIYCEKPTADNLDDAIELARAAKKAAGIKHGVVQDKLFLPGLLKLKMLIDSGFFGRILSVRGEFGYWVFEGDWQPANRPSWNYRNRDGGGIVLDMLCHWRYVLDNLFGEVRAVSCRAAVHIPRRVDEDGKPYDADADDAAYATFELDNDIIAHINSSWCTRVRRDDLVTFHVDGTHGSAVAGLQTCYSQARVNTPRPVWNPDVPQPIKLFDTWAEVPGLGAYDNGFKTEWEMFIRHLYEGSPFKWTLLEGAKGVQLAEAGLQSSRERRWIDIPPLTV
jgi:predicted dehydrogenase